MATVQQGEKLLTIDEYAAGSASAALTEQLTLRQIHEDFRVRMGEFFDDE